MALPEDPDEIVPSSEALGGFVGRVPESETLARSLEVHRKRIDDATIDIQRLRHVLVFHVTGGVGKTELSRRLAHRLTDGPDAPDGRGTRPATRVAAVARWECLRSPGDLDPVALLLELRRAFGRVRPMRPEPTQWLEPFEVVAERWIGHLHRVKARAWSRASEGGS